MRKIVDDKVRVRGLSVLQTRAIFQDCKEEYCAWWIKEGEGDGGEKNKEGCALKVLAVSLSQINFLGVRVES